MVNEIVEQVRIFHPGNFSRKALTKYLILFQPEGKALRIRKNYAFEDKKYLRRAGKAVEKTRAFEREVERKGIIAHLKRAKKFKKTVRTMLKNGDLVEIDGYNFTPENARRYTEAVHYFIHQVVQGRSPVYPNPEEYNPFTEEAASV